MKVVVVVSGRVLVSVRWEIEPTLPRWTNLSACSGSIIFRMEIDRNSWGAGLGCCWIQGPRRTRAQVVSAGAVVAVAEGGC